MAIGLKHAATIVAYPRRELKLRVEGVVKRLKKADYHYSLSQYVIDAIVEKLERDEAPTQETHLTNGHS